MTEKDETLETRARRLGVQTSYTDVMGETHTADPEALAVILEEVGEPPAGPEPVRVVWDGGWERLEYGYHRETVTLDGEQVERLVICAPSRSFGADLDEFGITAFG